MHNRAFLKVALLGLLALALVPGLAAAGQEMLASQAAERATAVSGPIIDVSPLSHDYGLVLVGGASSFDFTVSNMGDADLHISAGVPSDPQLTASFGSMTVSAGSSTMMSVTYTPTSGAALVASVEVQSDAANDPHFSVNALGRGNTAPTLTLTPPGPSYNAAAFVMLVIDVTANDAEGDFVTLSASGLPVGASFDGSLGHFEWTPGPADAGSYSVTFCGTDGAETTCETVSINVTAGNNPPIADPGGPYSGGTGEAVQFDGSGSSDPDGNSLTYSWLFGDGGTGSGVNPVHTYAAAGSYLASLTVTDNGAPPLSDTGVCSVDILSTIPVQLIVSLGHDGKLRTWGLFWEQIGLETIVRPVTDIDPATLRMTADQTCTVSEISALTKGWAVGDMDKDGVGDLDVWFTRRDLDRLLQCRPNNSLATLTVFGRTKVTAGFIPVSGSATVTIRTRPSWWPWWLVRAFASPNPFNPETTISYSLQNSGNTSVRIFSLQGRLIRTLYNGYAGSGENEVRWNGRDDSGRPVASGLYFVKVQQGAESGVFKVMVAK
jgi:hypothetical protein